MSTFVKGTWFEDLVYDMINQQLKNREFICKDDNYKLYKKKSYYSNDRKSFITVDLSIEYFKENEMTPSFYYFIECKNYKSPVQIEKLEILKARVDQIGENKARGIFITNAHIQKSGYNYSKTHSIAIMKVNISDNSYYWELNRLSNYFKYIFQNPNAYSIDKINELFLSHSKNMNYGIFNGIVSFTVVDLLKNIYSQTSLNEEVKYQKIHIKNINDGEIENITKNLLFESGYINGEVSLNNLINAGLKSNIKVKIDTKLENYFQDNELLGKINFKNNEIIAYQNYYVDNYRMKFTIAHELGHYYLNHNLFLEREAIDFAIYNNSYKSLINKLKVIETQANKFAGYLLIPSSSLIYEFNKYLTAIRSFDRWKGKLYVDNQRINKYEFNKVIKYLQYIFRVNKQVIEIRLKSLDLIIDKRTKPNHIGFYRNIFHN